MPDKPPLDAQERETTRKSINHFRKKRREGKIEETNPELDELMRKILPSYYKLQEYLAEAADSPWYALQELERFHTHCETVHKGGACEEIGCLEDFTMEDGKDFTATIMKYLKETHGTE